MESQLQACLDSGIVSFKGHWDGACRKAGGAESREKTLSLFPDRSSFHDFRDGEGAGSGNLPRIVCLIAGA